MPRKKKGNVAPIWAYEDNPQSMFGMIYDDMLKSQTYQELKCSEKQFLTVCIVHSNTKESEECLYNALKERYEKLGEPLSEYDLNRLVHDRKNRKFVFPKKQYEKYGYSKSYASKSLKALEKSGFIREIQVGTITRVSIYEFSTNWKRK